VVEVAYLANVESSNLDKHRILAPKAMSRMLVGVNYQPASVVRFSIYNSLSINM